MYNLLKRAGTLGVALCGALVFTTDARAAGQRYRYHGILIAHDNLPKQNGSFVEPPRGVDPRSERGLELVPYSADPQGGDPLDFTLNDALRFERFLARHTPASLITTLLPPGASPPAPQGGETVSVTRGESTVAGVRQAFHDTACRIGGLKTGEAPADCAPPPPSGRGDDFTDVVYVHFAGHGVYQGLMLADDILHAKTIEGASRPALREPGFQELIDQLKDAGAELVVVVLDSCYASGFDERGGREVNPATDVPRVIQGQRGVAVFRAAGVVPELRELGSGALTHVVLSGLMGAADENHDQRITFAELSDHYWLNSTRGGEFDGKTESPGSNQHAVLMDLRHGHGEEVLSLSSELGGRFVVVEKSAVPVAGADGEGALADGVVTEVNVQGGWLLKGRDIELRIPHAGSETLYDLYHLGVDADGEPAGPVGRVEDWSPVEDRRQWDSFPDAPVLAGAVPEYLRTSQTNDGMFARHRIPAGARRVGRQAAVGLGLGYQRAQAPGAIHSSDSDDDALVFDDFGNEKESSHQGWLIDNQPALWDLAQLSAVARLHPLNLPPPFQLQIEARAHLEVGPSAVFEAGEATVLRYRGLAGAGLGGHLGRRSLMWALSGGAGGTRTHTWPESQSCDPELNPDADPECRAPGNPTIYASSSLSVLRTSGTLFFELLGFRDRVEMEVGAALDSSGDDGFDTRDYYAVTASIGLELGRWSW